jgi:hypothetical protein
MLYTASIRVIHTDVSVHYLPLPTSDGKFRIIGARAGYSCAGNAETLVIRDGTTTIGTITSTATALASVASIVFNTTSDANKTLFTAATGYIKVSASQFTATGDVHLAFDLSPI